MWAELSDLGSRLLADTSLRCLVIAGEGPSFSSGIDLVEGLAAILARFGKGHLDDETRAAGLRAAGTFRWIPKLACPSVAAVQGHAYGAGLQLALSCDFRILTRGATVGLIETRFGIMPDMGATVRLPRIVGESRARELILLGDIIDSSEALRIGLANRVVDEADLAATVAGFAARLAAQPPLAIQGARRALDAAWYSDPDAAFQVAVDEQLRCLASEDVKEAGAAITEGHAPRWTGR